MKRTILIAAAAALLISGAAAAQPAGEGRLYLFSGQSNMELPVNRCLDVVGNDVKDYSNPAVHYMKLPLRYEFDGPVENLVPGRWSDLTPENAGLWGALCYFVGKGLNEALGEDIWMVNTAIGGTPIEAWMRADSLPSFCLPQLEQCRDPQWVQDASVRSREIYVKWQEALNQKGIDPNAKWSKVDMFSEEWATDESGAPIYGLHFLKTDIRLNSAQAGSDATLHLGAIVDADSVFVNGHFVGTTSYRYPPRNYPVPASALKKGKNTIEVHLRSHRGECAKFIRDKEYSLETPAGTVQLPRKWNHCVAARMPERDAEIFLQYMPTGLYNAMTAPLKPSISDGSIYGAEASGKPRKLSGVVWYQGESNIERPEIYADELRTMIREWRELFEDDNLPFYIVELAAYMHSELLSPESEGWRAIQDAQRRVAEEMDGVYLVPGRDLGEWNDIHPQDKKTLGERVVKAILENENKTHKSINR